MKRKQRLCCVFLSMVMVAVSCSIGAVAVDTVPPTMPKNNDYPLIFVHGLNGWGASEGINETLPYWGATTGDVTVYLGELGYDCYSVSVGPISSAWDRACEIYAQLTGTTVDYGEAHSKQFNHLRYGRTYDEPIIENWDAVNKVHLIGHSFGGTAVRMLSYLLENGSETEKAENQENISNLFTGGNSGFVCSVTTICTPHNSSTLYYPMEAFKLTNLVMSLSVRYAGLAGRSLLNGRFVDFHLEQFGLTNIPGQENADDYKTAVRRMLDNSQDTAQYDITPVGAQAFNELVDIQPNVYFFGYSFSTTNQGWGDTQSPIEQTNPLLKLPAFIMGIMLDRRDRKLGIDYDAELWRANDGLVNTVSAQYPFDEPHTQYDSANIKTGEWNVMPVRVGDHGSAIGLNASVDDTHAFFCDIAQMLCALPVGANTVE